MQIVLITPARPASRSGNRATATRWANLLRKLGHKVLISSHFDGQPADIMIALHAWRSADAIDRFAKTFPMKPLIVAMTGTDAYRFIHSHTETTLRSIYQAHFLVGLHDLIANVLPPQQRDKMHVIYQSAKPIAARKPYQRYFHVSVMGHLRDEKDSLRPALASRYLPADSRIQIHQYGKAHNEDWKTRAEKELQQNSRYHWHGEIPHHRIRRVYQRTNLLVLPSRMEGGANVISEAVVAGVPVIASDIEGSIGLLGANYPGYYPVGDEHSLSDLLYRCETDPAFYQALVDAGQQKQDMFSEKREMESWRVLLKIASG